MTSSSPPTISRTTSSRTVSSRTIRLLVAAALAVTLLVAGALGVSRRGDHTQPAVAPDAPVVAAAGSISGPLPADLDLLIEQLQARLDLVPSDHVAWSTLGLAYVEQARVTADPSYYPRAEGALDQSFAVEPDGNFLGHAGRSALAAARHDFTAAELEAELGLAINPYSAILYGALSDAQVQLGNYGAAEEAARRMLELAPGTPAYARASYLAELRGDIVGATVLMEQALDAASSAADRAFALTILGDLAFGAGEPGPALTLYNRARVEAPDDVAALAGKARAEAALGQIETALGRYAELVEIAPEPSFVVAYGRLLQSVGRTEEAAEQFAVVDAVQQLFTANGVEADAGPIIDLAERRDPTLALLEAERAVSSRPFVLIHDAHAWALHVNGRHREALSAMEAALQLGTRDARLYFHAGMIKYALGDLVGAHDDLSTALDINPYFDPIDAEIAASTLRELGVSS